jgi:hypothetical protein
MSTPTPKAFQHHNLFDLANLPSTPTTPRSHSNSFSEVHLSTDLKQIFSCLSALDFTTDDLRAISKILAAILHIGNINPADAHSSIVKIGRKGIGIPLPPNSSNNRKETTANHLKSGDFWHLRENCFSCGLISSNELADLLGIDELQLRDVILSDIHSSDKKVMYTKMTTMI